VKRNRRELLKLVGATGVSGAAITRFPGIASASSPSIPASTSGYINSSDWDTFEAYHKQQEYDGTNTNSINPDGIAIPDNFAIPNPTSIPFDVCAQLPDGEQLCISTFEPGATEFHDCAGRELFTVGQDIVKESISVDGEFTVEWSVEVWIGIDSDGCVWLGMSSGGQEECSMQYCPVTPTTTVADQKEDTNQMATEIADELIAHGGTAMVAGSAAAVAAGAIAAGSGRIALDKA
jgi:hypothetical protein